MNMQSRHYRVTGEENEDALVPAGVFFGNTVARREVSGFRLSETRYSPDLRIPLHSHACANFCFVLRGSYAEVYERRPRACRPSTLIFHPLGEMHSDRHDPIETSILCVEIDAQRLETVREHSVILDTSADFQGGRTASLGARLYSEFRWRDDDVSSLALEGLTLEIMAEASRRLVSPASRQPPRWLKQARDLLQSEYVTPRTLGGMAEAVGVHPVHLAREFRRHYRCTIADCIRSLRVEAACRLLAVPGASLGEVALSVGFADQSHFTRIFKQHTGMTPAQYRKVFAGR